MNTDRALCCVPDRSPARWRSAASNSVPYIAALLIITFAVGAHAQTKPKPPPRKPSPTADEEE